MTTQIDPEAISMEELEALANAEIAGNPPEKKTVETQADPAVQPQADPVEEDEIVYRREIDLGDGSGVQVFEGASYDELVDKLANAQLHATRKIKELSTAKKVEAKAEELTPEQEFLLSQELTSKPSKAIKALIESTLGMSVEEFRKTQEELRSFRAEKVAETDAVRFVQETPDYFASAKNGEKMSRYLKTFNLEPSVDNYRKAFNDLNESGLLEARPATDNTSATSTQATTNTRIAEVEEQPVVTQRKAGSGISTRGRTASRVEKTTLSEADLYDMPLDKLEALVRAGA